MGPDHHHASERIEPFESLPDFDFARNVSLGLEMAQQQDAKQNHAISTFHS
jgi:hypothetical protein